MAEGGMSRFVYVRLYINDSCEGKYICGKCGFRRPWKGENHTETRCENPNGQCNSLMKLHLDK